MKRISILAIVGVAMQILAIMLIGLFFHFHIEGVFVEYKPNVINLFVCAALVLMLVGWVLIASFFWAFAKDVKKTPCAMGWLKHITDFICCFACPFLALFCGWEFLRYLVLDWMIKNKAALSGLGIERIVTATAWPIVTFILVFLFRKQLLLSLAQLPGLIRRSRYDNRTINKSTTITTGEGKRGMSGDIDKESQSCGSEISLGNDIRENKGTVHVGMDFERAVLKVIDEEFWPFKIMRESCIDDSQLRFDAAIKRDGWVYGVEIKYAKDIAVLQRSIQYMANRIDGIYADFPEYTKKKFIFMLCICLGGSINDIPSIPSEITQIFIGKPYRLEIRLYDESGNKKDFRRM